MDSWKAVLDEGGKVLINGNNIVLQHIVTNEVAYLEDNPANRVLLKLNPNEFPEELPPKNQEKSESLCDQDEMSISLHEETDNNRDNKDNKKIKWTIGNTKLLIQTRLSSEKEFNRPKCKKIKLWQNIAKKLNDELMGTCHVSAEECDNKFRNLLKTYKVNKKKQSSTGESVISWEYFQDFDEVLGCKASIEPPKNTLVDTMDLEQFETDNEQIEIPETEDGITSGSENYELNVTSCEPGPSTSNVGSSIGKAKKKPLVKKVLQFKEYLYVKNKREEEKEKKKELFLQEKWRDEKELKKDEINAILKLADAISSSNK